MEPLNLSSKIVENGKEFLIQTVNETGTRQIKTTVFENGELLDTNAIPHAEDAGRDEIHNLIKNTHEEKKTELEYLFKSYKEIIQTGQPQMMYHLGTSLFYKKLYFEAQQLLRTAIKFDENYHEAYIFLARINIALNHYDDAIDSADKAVAMQPKYADYRNILGEAFLGAQSCKRAIVEFEKAIASNVYYADAYLNMALAYLLNEINNRDQVADSELTDTCIDYLRKAALIYPEYQSENFDRGLSLLGSGDLKKAFDVFWSIREEKREKTRQQKAAHFNRFLIYTDWLSEDSISERIKVLERELDRNPDYVDLYYDLGVCYLQQAKLIWKKGNGHLQKALEINPKLKKARWTLDCSREEFLRISDTITKITESEKG